jgi:hypothetical protein
MNHLSPAFKNIIAVASLPMAIVDTAMRHLAVSEKWISFYGLENMTLIGRSHYEIFPEIGERWKKIHAECLNLCDDFVHKHGGQLSAESEENACSTFFFTIPAELLMDQPA